MFVIRTADADLLLNWYPNLMQKPDVKTYNKPSQEASMGYSLCNRCATYNLKLRDSNRCPRHGVHVGETTRDQAALDSDAMRVLAGFPLGQRRQRRNLATRK